MDGLTHKEVQLKRLLKWTAAVLAAFIGLALLSCIVLYSIGLEKLNRAYPDLSVEKINLPTDPDAVARGRHIATIWGCTQCHGEDLGGALMTNDPIEGRIPILGSIPASNLTSGKGGIAQSYDVTDWVRAIRHGVEPGGQVEIFMYDYSTLSDRDLGDLIAYLKQVPPVDSAYPPENYGPIIPFAAALGIFAPVAERIDHSARRTAAPVPGATKEYGQYLSAVCDGCHGNGLVAPLRGQWKQEDFVRAVRTGILPNGGQIGPAMPARIYGEMNDTELTALWLYWQNPPSAQAR